MTQIHPPTASAGKVFHNVTCDGGGDVELTRFVEWVETVWLVENTKKFNILDVKWDNGHDTLRFETNCDIIDLSDEIQRMSATFNTMFMMYDYYTSDEIENYQEAVRWFYEGKVQKNSNRH